MNAYIFTIWSLLFKFKCIYVVLLCYWSLKKCHGFEMRFFFFFFILFPYIQFNLFALYSIRIVRNSEWFLLNATYISFECINTLSTDITHMFCRLSINFLFTWSVWYFQHFTFSCCCCCWMAYVIQMNKISNIIQNNVIDAKAQYLHLL